MGVKRPRNILSGRGRPLADRFPEGRRRALGCSWAVPFEAGTLSSDTQTYEIRRHPIYERHGVRPGRAWTLHSTAPGCLVTRPGVNLLLTRSPWTSPVLGSGVRRSPRGRRQNQGEGYALLVNWVVQGGERLWHAGHPGCQQPRSARLTTHHFSRWPREVVGR